MPTKPQRPQLQNLRHSQPNPDVFLSVSDIQFACSHRIPRDPWKNFPVPLFSPDENGFLRLFLCITFPFLLDRDQKTHPFPQQASAQ